MAASSPSCWTQDVLSLVVDLRDGQWGLSVCHPQATETVRKQGPAPGGLLGPQSPPDPTSTLPTQHPLVIPWDHKGGSSLTPACLFVSEPGQPVQRESCWSVQGDIKKV